MYIYLCSMSYVDRNVCQLVLIKKKKPIKTMRTENGYNIGMNCDRQA